MRRNTDTCCKKLNVLRVSSTFTCTKKHSLYRKTGELVEKRSPETIFKASSDVHFCIVSLLYQKTVIRVFILRLFLYFTLSGSKVKVKTICSISMIKNISIFSQYKSGKMVLVSSLTDCVWFTAQQTSTKLNLQRTTEMLWVMVFEEELKRKTFDSKLSEG